MKRQVIKKYTEADHTFPELTRIFIEEAAAARQEGYNVEFISQKPILDDEDRVIGITHNQPMEVVVFRWVHNN